MSAISNPNSPVATTPPRTLHDVLSRALTSTNTPAQFLTDLLTLQVQVTGAVAGALYRLPEPHDVSQDEVSPDDLILVHRILPVASADENARWLRHASECVIENAVRPQDGIVSDRLSHHAYVPEGPSGRPGGQTLCQPQRATDQGRYVSAILLETGDPQMVAFADERLAWTGPLFASFLHSSGIGEGNRAIERLVHATGVFIEANQHTRFGEIASALCHGLASRFVCDRVALGMYTREHVRLASVSHAEEFSRRTSWVRQAEQVMEECVDQDTEILIPAPLSPTFVHRAADEMIRDHGPRCLCTFPLRVSGSVVGALMVERPAESPFSAEDVETIRLICELTTSRLLERHVAERWIGAKCAAAARRGLAILVGPTHTYAKVASILLFAVAVSLIFVKGPDRVSASFTVRAADGRTITSPVDGILESSDVQPGDRVVGGQTVLARLETDQLKIELASAKAARKALLTDADIARGESDPAREQLAVLGAKREAARIEAIEYRIHHSTIRATIDGVVLKGDERHRLGAPISAGQTMYEIAPHLARQIEIEVPEDRINDVEIGQHGHLTLASHPQQRFPFEVTRISPVVHERDGETLCKVDCRLLDLPSQNRITLRPGMQGVARINVGRASYGDLLTRDVVRWVQMRFW